MLSYYQAHLVSELDEDKKMNTQPFSHANPIERHAYQDLQLFIDNDSDLYMASVMPKIEYIQKRLKAGDYDHTKAAKLWLYLIDEGARKYCQVFKEKTNKFPKHLREELAKDYAAYYLYEIQLGNYKP
jgi:hypothetical protein